MFASRTVLRSTRPGFRMRRPLPRQVRLQSTSSSSNSNGSSLPPGLAGGVAGGALVFLLGYGYYHFSGTKQIVNSVRSVKTKFEQYPKQLKEAAPEPSQALQWLRETAHSYAGFIPGAKQYVDSAFDDLDAIHDKHGDEVDKIVSDMYNDLKDVSKKGMSLDAAQDAGAVLQKHLGRIYELAADSAQDIINNHPSLKNAVGKELDQLKALGDQYGPDAKKELDKTWDQIQDVIKTGFSAETANKIRKIVQEKLQKMRELGDEAWKKGMEKAKPYLDKSPQVKELIEKNADSLKQGNVTELYEKVKESVDSGKIDSLENYVKSLVNKAKQQSSGSRGGGGGLSQYLNMIPGAEKILPKLNQLQEVAQEHGDEAEKIVKETFEEIQQVLNKRVKQVEDLAEKVKEKAK